MSTSKQVILTEADVSRMNIAKRNQIDPLSHKHILRKKNRDTGLPYRGKNGSYHPGILPPSDVSQ